MSSKELLWQEIYDLMPFQSDQLLVGDKKRDTFYQEECTKIWNYADNLRDLGHLTARDLIWLKVLLEKAFQLGVATGEDNSL